MTRISFLTPKPQIYYCCFQEAGVCKRLFAVKVPSPVYAPEIKLLMLACTNHRGIEQKVQNKWLLEDEAFGSRLEF